eukprot:41572-Chlamydomonas_euryale.AAC.1
MGEGGRVGSGGAGAGGLGASGVDRYGTSNPPHSTPVPRCHAMLAGRLNNALWRASASAPPHTSASPHLHTFTPVKHMRCN